MSGTYRFHGTLRILAHPRRIGDTPPSIGIRIPRHPRSGPALVGNKDRPSQWTAIQHPSPDTNTVPIWDSSSSFPTGTKPPWTPPTRAISAPSRRHRLPRFGRFRQTPRGRMPCNTTVSDVFSRFFSRCYVLSGVVRKTSPEGTPMAVPWDKRQDVDNDIHPMGLQMPPHFCSLP